MKASTKKALLIAGGVVVAGATVAAVAYAAKGPTGPGGGGGNTGSSGPTGAPYTFQAGHTYRVALTGPGLPPTITPAAVQTFLSTAFPGVFQVLNASPTSTGGLAYAVQVLQNLSVPNSQALNPLQSLLNILVSITPAGVLQQHGWQPATQVAPGDEVFLSIDPSVLLGIGALMNPPVTQLNPTTVLQMINAVLNISQPSSTSVQPPGQPSDPSWPTQDTTKWRIQTVYPNVANAPTIQVSLLPGPVQVWVYR